MIDYNTRLSAAILGAGVALVQMQSAQALTKVEVSKVAQSITVMIQNDQNPQMPGSGIIIKREGETYTILTAHHVVKQSGNYKVMTSDKKMTPIVQGSVKPLPGVDLALVQFKSSGSYSIAKMGDSAQNPSGSASFVAGFPGTTEVRSEPEYYFTSGEIAANGSRPNKDGYALAYSNPTLPGMSGGPVLNEQGELIGIHGRAENAAVPQNAKIRDDVYVLKTEFNYAIPINTFLTLAPQVNKTLALRTSSPSVSSAPKADDFFLQAEEKSKRGDYKGAIADFNQVLRLNPSYGAAYPGRGVARSNLGDKKGAIEDLSQAIRLNPNNLSAYASRGLAKDILEDKQGADADFKKALSLNIDAQDYRAYINRGIVRWRLGDKEGAIADFNQAINLNPNYVPAYIHRGTRRAFLGDKQGAIADFNQAIQVNPTDSNSYSQRGSFRYYNLKDRQGAIADFDQAIRLNTKNLSAYHSRGFIRYNLGDEQGAIADFDQAIRLDPTEASSYEKRAFFRSEKLKDKKGAIADFQKAADLYKAQGIEWLYQAELMFIERIKACSTSTMFCGK